MPMSNMARIRLGSSAVQILAGNWIPPCTAAPLSRLDRTWRRPVAILLLKFALGFDLLGCTYFSSKTVSRYSHACRTMDFDSRLSSFSNESAETSVLEYSPRLTG